MAVQQCVCETKLPNGEEMMGFVEHADYCRHSWVLCWLRAPLGGRLEQGHADSKEAAVAAVTAATHAREFSSLSAFIDHAEGAGTPELVMEGG